MEYLSWQSRSKVIPIIILKIPIQEELKLSRITDTNFQRFQKESFCKIIANSKRSEARDKGQNDNMWNPICEEMWKKSP